MLYPSKVVSEALIVYYHSTLYIIIHPLHILILYLTSCFMCIFFETLDESKMVPV